MNCSDSLTVTSHKRMWSPVSPAVLRPPLPPHTSPLPTPDLVISVPCFLCFLFYFSLYFSLCLPLFLVFFLCFIITLIIMTIIILITYLSYLLKTSRAHFCRFQTGSPSHQAWFSWQSVCSIIYQNIEASHSTVLTMFTFVYHSKYFWYVPWS